jgi:hypothetical protein
MFARWIQNAKLFIAVAIFGTASSFCFAQFSGSVKGTVSDPSGAVIAGASLKLTATEIGVSYTAQTDSTGTYTFNDLRPGHYTLRVERDGFSVGELSFVVETSETSGENIVLKPGSTTTEIQVTENPTGVNPEETRLQATISSEEISRLPVVGRGIYNLVQVAPGVTGLQGDTTGSTPNDNFTIGTSPVNASSSGRPNLSNNFMLDGISLLSSTSTGNVDLTPNPDAIQEATFQTLTYNVDQGMSSALTANFTTKSGTNQFHGDIDATYSSKSFIAHQYLENLQNPIAFRRSYFGASVGGPLIKDKTFFFGAAQIKRSVSGSTSSIGFIIPTELVNFMHAALPNSNPAAILAQYPIDPKRFTVTSRSFPTLDNSNNPGGPCGTDPGQADDLIIPCDTPTQESGTYNNSPIENGEQWNARLDQYFRNGKDRISGSIYRYSQYSQYLDAARPTFADSATPTQADFLTASYTHLFSSNLLNDAQFALLRSNNNGFLAGPYTTFPLLGLGGGGASPFYVWYASQPSPFGPSINKEHHYNFRNTASWTRGRHDFKFGFEALHWDYFTDDSGNYARAYQTTYFNNGVYALLSDTPPTSASYYTIGLDDKYQAQKYGAQQTNFALTYNDQWKLKANFLLSYGGRFDIFGNPYNYGNGSGPYAALFAPSATPAGIAQVSSRLVNNALSGRRYEFQPRVGFNWTPLKYDSKLSLRGGFGIYLDAINPAYVSVNLPTNVPSRLTINYPAPGVSSPLPSVFGLLADQGTPPYGRTYPTVNVVGLDSRGGVISCCQNGSNFIFPAGQNGFDRNLTPQKSALFSLGFEQQFVKNLVAGFTYSGSVSWDQIMGGDYNALPNGMSVTPEFGQIAYAVNGGEGNYNSLIAVLRQTINAFQWQASYTWGHALSDPLGSQGPLNTGPYVNGPYDLKNQYSSSPYDVRNRFSFSSTYRIPDFFKEGWKNWAASGWELDAIVIAQSGNPFTVLTSSSTDGSSTADGRKGVPTILTAQFPRRGFTRGQFRETATGSGGIFNNVYNSTSNSSSDPYFGAPPVGTLGNAPYDGFTGPGYQSFDLAAGKAFNIPWFGGEKSVLLLRTEFINAFNRFNPGPIDNTYTDQYFGQATSAYQPRILQLGGRFQF